MIEQKVLKLLSRFDEVEKQLGEGEVIKDQKLFKKLAQEHAYLSEIKHNWEKAAHLRKELEDNRSLAKEETDPDFQRALAEDSARIEGELATLEKELEDLLVPPDPDDHRNSIVELRAGTGGDEASLFVGDTVRMYKLFADKKGWKWELLSCTPSEMGGFKEYVMVLSGKNVYRMMQYEAGTHRVQRVPETEAQGRVHTSAITVAVLKEPSESEEIKIEEKDLRIDTYRSSGAGGQHVNTTDSAVRITHIPTGVVVSCQEERSQHKNKDKAMRFLAAKLAEAEQERQHQEQASTRSSQVGSGDRSERIRTYNFPQNRVTDHRINLTQHNLDQVMNGELDSISSALVAHFHKEKLAS